MFKNDFKRTAEQLQAALDVCDDLSQICRYFKIAASSQNRGQLRQDYKRIGIDIDVVLEEREKDDLAIIVAQSTSLTDVCRNMGLEGRNSQTRERWRDRIEKWGIDTSHFTRKEIPPELLREIVPKVFSVYAVAVALGRKPSVEIGLDNLKRKILALGLDISHFKKGENPRVAYPRQIPNEKLFIDGIPYSATHRRRVIQDKLLPFYCAMLDCKSPRDEDVTMLILDHRNGKTSDNRLVNYRFVCPNCNHKLPTNGAKNRVYQREQAELERLKKEAEAAKPDEESTNDSE